MEGVFGRGGADGSAGEEEDWEDGEERRDQSDGRLALQQTAALLRRNIIVSVSRSPRRPRPA